MTFKTKKIQYYRLITGGTFELPNSYSVETFKSKTAAFKHWQNEYKNRNKRDGYDKHWNNIPLIIIKVTEYTDLIAQRP